VTTSRVEISQQRTIPLLIWLVGLLRIIPLRINEIRDNQLNCTLRPSVGVCRADGTVFRDGNHVGNSRRVAIDSRGGGEHDVVYIVLLHAA
jgi:hypothetical protein